MARYQEGERPVSDDEFEGLPERISEHFDDVRDELEQALDDSE